MVPNTQLPAAYWSPISTLRKWAKNPRKNDHAVPRVARSIRKYGFVAPVVVWQSQGRLVVGRQPPDRAHLRLRASGLNTGRWNSGPIRSAERL